jgi:hypothetical protein
MRPGEQGLASPEARSTRQTWFLAENMLFAISLGVDVGTGVDENHRISRRGNPFEGPKYLYCITGGLISCKPNTQDAFIIGSGDKCFWAAVKCDSDLWAQADGNGESDDIGVKKKTSEGG